MQTAIKPGTHCGGRASAPASVFLRLIGGLIQFAAVMRGVQALGSPTSAPGLLSLPSIPAVTIAWEIFLGLWLISGALPKAARRIAIGCFSVFACYTLYEALAGKADCGCLGQVKVNPWFTVVLDVSIALALVFLDNPAEDVLRKQQNLHFYVTKSSSAHIYIMETVFRRTIIGNWSRKDGVQSKRELRNFGFRAFRNP